MAHSIVANSATPELYINTDQSVARFRLALHPRSYLSQKWLINNTTTFPLFKVSYRFCL